jgi:GxxExxY protein
VFYQGIRMEAGFRADLIIEDKVIIEIKSVETVAPVHKKQLLTYLRLANSVWSAHQLQCCAHQRRHRAHR